MSTIILSAVGAAVGGSVGGGVLGLSSVVIGRALGATVGRAIDQRLMGAGSQTVEQGRVDRLRLTGASEGAPLGQVYGRMRVAGQVIWATRFQERVSTETTGGKGSAPAPKVTTTTYSYSVSLAIALCDGEVARVGRIWADGQEIAPTTLNLRLYPGDHTQLPDPKIEAVQGSGSAPAYRGTAYVVIEDLDLTPYGNRVPQFTFEIFRPAQADAPGANGEIAHVVQAVALIPGTGEYALATRPVYYDHGPGQKRPANLATPSGKPDFATSLDALNGELPGCGSVSLVVSWFGNDLRCGSCAVQPMVEQTGADGDTMPWQVSGLSRALANALPLTPEGGPVYGGTPADASVIEAIAALKAARKAVMFYPFLLMLQQGGNGLPDPYGGAEQAALPWRGRITTALAPGQAGTTDTTAAATAEVASFFGNAQPGDFTASGVTITYSGPAEFSFRRMILHYAHLCKLAGGVEAFCIGSELRGLTQIRDDAGFPAVAQMIQLAADVRSILGPETKISYAADWSEYFGYQTPEGDLRYHLDPLWADDNIDFVGIDNYMPLSDWRDGWDHVDAAYGSIYAQDYLSANIEGGEGYDWYYAAPEHRDAQIRTPITDGLHGEHWIWRTKDIRNWWLNDHHDRLAGARVETPSLWVPQSKPIWFTEIGCAAIDKGTNQPNRFLDPRSSESGLPHYSNGQRDDFLQMQYLRAVTGYWGDPSHNPVSVEYDAPMIDMTRAHVWAWDARPYPFFPGNVTLWADGANYARGHWLNGRASNRSLAGVVEEICLRAGLQSEMIDTSALWGLVRGYVVDDLSDARAALQPLMLAYGFDAVEREGKLIFASRTGRAGLTLTPDLLALDSDADSAIELNRAAHAEVAGRVQLTFVEADGDYGARAEEAIFPDEATQTVSRSEVPLALTRAEGRQITERWLAEARVARDGASFALPLSQLGTGAGDVVALETPAGVEHYRIDRLTQTGERSAEALRVEPEIYLPSDATEEFPTQSAVTVPVPVLAQFLDLPLMRGDEVPHAPHIAVTARPWPGSVMVWSAAQDAGYAANLLVPGAAAVGTTETPLYAAPSGRWDKGAALRVRLNTGTLSSADTLAVLNGANLAAIGDGTSANWELFQFATATLVDEATWELTMLLRGQAGTDALAAEWPAGSRFVLMNGVPRQIELASSARGLARHYRIGPASVPYDDPVYDHRVEAFQGIGLRPLSPAHLRARRDGAGDLQITWTRRTRIDGDSWEGPDVPLGEASESYQLRVRHAGAIKHTATLSAPAYSYTAAQQASDGVTAPFDIEVAQISESFGAGLFTKGEING